MYLQTQMQTGADTSLFPVVLDEMTVQELAVQTEGFSYQKLSMLLYFARMLEKARAAAQNSDWEDIRLLLVRRYYPVKRTEMQQLVRMLRPRAGTFTMPAGMMAQPVRTAQDAEMRMRFADVPAHGMEQISDPQDTVQEIKKMMDGDIEMNHIRLLAYMGLGQ